VEEQERKSIAIGLHDSVGYNLVDIETELKKLKKTTSNPEITAKLENLEVMVNWVVQKTRLLTFKLSNPTLRKLGFVAAVKQWLEEQIKGKYGIKCKLITNNSIIQLDKNVSIILYKIVQELTMNVVKHANANTLKVQIKQTNGQIQIAIKDDGVGFSADSFSDIPQAKRYNLGLFAAKERLEFIGGSLNLKSAPGRGTCAKVTSPISNTELNIDYLEG
jgi:signal transduction histidine kinase